MNRMPSAFYRVPLTQARTHLGKLARRAHLNHEFFILEKDGVPLAGVIGLAELEDFLELMDPKLNKQIAAGYAEYVRGEAQPAREFLAELTGTSMRRRTQ